MIEVYAFATPNSIRISIALEERGLPYNLTSINVRNGEQKVPGYLAINPSGTRFHKVWDVVLQVERIAS